MPALDNARHEKFAQELSKGKTADEAYVIAGYRENRGNAATLKANQSVLDRIQELQNNASLRVEITVASLIEEAAAIQKSALEAKNHSAAVSALTAKAKLAGLWVEKSETENVNTNYVVSSDPVDNVEEWEAEHAPKH